MGVYIHGMEMPTNCCQCPVNMEVCKRGYKYLLAHPELYDKRADDCPLVPVPPHGRLIDADALMMHKGNCYDADGHLLYAVGTGNIMCAPTIIPADGKDTDVPTKEEGKHITNADRIRTMTNEELAFYIVNHPMWSDESACVAWLKSQVEVDNGT